MVQLHVPSATAHRLWALPGAMMVGRRPVFENGVVRLGTEPVVAPCPSYLIEHPKGLVLFDTGLSPRGIDDPDAYFGILAQLYKMQFTADLAVDAQLRELGYSLDEISYVVPSHLHFDHAGGLYLFPDATLFVGVGELSYAYWPPPGPACWSNCSCVRSARPNCGGRRAIPLRRPGQARRCRHASGTCRRHLRTRSDR